MRTRTAPPPEAQSPDLWVRRFARTTPGVISAMLVGIAALCVVAGLVCWAQLDGRLDKGRAVLDRSEPLAYSAQQLYAALSAADTTAATAFLTAGIETVQMRARYQDALADAAAALADTTAGATDTETRAALATISAQLTAYTGLVASAEVNNRQKFVVGSSYFREASSLMQNELLPGAKKVFLAELAGLDEDQRAAGSTPWLGVGLLLLVLVVIGVSSVVLSRRTNRQFNIGLVIAAAMVLMVIGWIIVATRLAAANIERSRAEGTASFGRLGSARIVGEQARTDEILELIARTEITAGEASFTGHIQELTGLLADGPAAASDAVVKWTAAHRKQVQAFDGGDYMKAVTLAVGADPDGSAAQFGIVEDSVRTDIERTRSILRDQMAASQGRLAWSPTGTLVLMVIAASAAVVGLWPRLKEFL